MPDTQLIFNSMCETFIKAQKREAHDECISTLTQAYNNYDFNKFCESYVKCIQILLSYVPKEESMENALEFGVLFAVKVTSTAQPDDTESGFLKHVLDFILKKHDADLPGIRYRTCYFLNLILNAMDGNVRLSDASCAGIIVAMLQRMKDISPKVRVQAVYALQKMQQAGEDECQVIESYIFNLSHDPSSRVREAILKVMVENEKTRQSVIERTHDVNHLVRKRAYIFLSSVTPDLINRKQRREILSDGLQDENDVVLKKARKLLRTWLLHYDNKIITFLHEIESEKATDAGIIVLNNLFEVLTVDKLFLQLPIKPDTKTILSNELSSENTLFWYCFCKYLQQSKFTALFDQTLPKLDDFIGYIVHCCTYIVGKTDDCHKPTEQAVLYQLFQMIQLYNLTDENEKSRLEDLLESILKTEIPGLKLTELIVEIYEHLQTNPSEGIDKLTVIINNIGIPNDTSSLQSGDEKNKRPLSKCLAIISAMLKPLKIKKLTSVIKNLFDKIIVAAVHHDDANVHAQALKAVGLCLLLDSELAQENIYMFFMILNDNQYHTSWEISLDMIFELILKYGLNHFDFGNPADITSDEGNTISVERLQLNSSNNVIEILSLFFDVELPAIQLITVEGFIRLLFKRTIESVQVVSRLIVLLHIPYNGNPQLQRALKTFFKYYPLMRNEHQQILEKSFIPTIFDIFNAPSDSKLFGIDPFIVGHFILGLTRYKIYKTETVDSHYTAHNNISKYMLQEIIDSNNEKYVTILVKCLACVDIKITDGALQDEMLDMCDAVSKKWTNIKALKIFNKFWNSLKKNEQVDIILEESEQSEQSEDADDDNSDME